MGNMNGTRALFYYNHEDHNLARSSKLSFPMNENSPCKGVKIKQNQKNPHNKQRREA